MRGEPKIMNCPSYPSPFGWWGALPSSSVSSAAHYRRQGHLAPTQGFFVKEEGRGNGPLDERGGGYIRKGERVLWGIELEEASGLKWLLLLLQQTALCSGIWKFLSWTAATTTLFVVRFRVLSRRKWADEGGFFLGQTILSLSAVLSSSSNSVYRWPKKSQKHSILS